MRTTVFFISFISLSVLTACDSGLKGVDTLDDSGFEAFKSERCRGKGCQATPTPIPTATPLATATPLPTATPAATATPVATATPAPTATPSATPTPTPTTGGNFVSLIPPNPTATPVPKTLAYQTIELPKIASNFNINDWVRTGEIDSKAAYFFPDTVGAFRFQCKPSHNLYDDPIVYPGNPGASHLHTFFGNTMTNAHSTYESLRTNGNGTCMGGPVNRSAYWTPSLQIDDGDGNKMNDRVVMPDHATIYYKMNPLKAQLLPRGLRFIFGYRFDDPTKSSGFSWLCHKSGKSFKNLEELVADPANGCDAGTQIQVSATTPTCWDGRLDSPNHRDHISEGSYGSWGWYRCPDTHPLSIPGFHIAVVFTVGAEGINEVRKLYLSSDSMNNNIRGSTFHTDWFGAWDDGVMSEWMTHAVGNFQNLSSGQFGNNRGLVDPFAKDTTDQYNGMLDRANPRLVAPPPAPLNQAHSH